MLPTKAADAKLTTSTCRTPAIITSDTISKVLRQVRAQNLLECKLPTDAPVALFYDLDVFDDTLDRLKEAFGPRFYHCIAVKSCSHGPILRDVYRRHGVGVEAASMGEVMLGLEAGFEPSQMVFDSPCKTHRELAWALEQRIPCNLDNFAELGRAATIMQELGRAEGAGDASTLVGLRVNPLVGAGTIAALSVSTADSKFGIPLSDLDAILAAYEAHPWLNSVHVHVGSGGMATAVLLAGVKAVVGVAEAVNARWRARLATDEAFAATHAGRPSQVHCLDIGGGLPVNYWSDSAECSEPQEVVSFGAYAEELRAEVPALFLDPATEGGSFTRVITEYGQSATAKAGFLVSEVEFVKGPPERPIFMAHFGADTNVRQVQQLHTIIRHS